MRNINKYILASTLALGAVFTSCEEEVLVPVEDNTQIDAILAEISALENQVYEYNLDSGTVSITNRKLRNTLDSLQGVQRELRNNDGNHDTKVQYTVNVLSAGNFVQGRMAGIAGASVTVSQGAYIETKETDGGMAVFTGLEPGAATVMITSDDHSKVEMDVHFYADGSVSDADYYNAGTQVLLYPVSGKNAATIEGSLLANTNTLNDTLNRKYGTDAAVFGEKAGTYLAEPGVYGNPDGYRYSSVNYNYTQYNSYGETGNIYNNNPEHGSFVQFEKVPASFKLYALAKPDGSLMVNGYGGMSWNSNEQGYMHNAGYITNITYTDLVFEATINNDNTYSVTVPAATGNNLSIEFQTTEVIADHTRFTREADIWHDSQWYDNVVGAVEEEGSELKTFSYYNSSNNTVDVYSLNGDGSLVTINPNSKGDVARRIITEQFRYQIMGSTLSNGNNLSLEPGQVEFHNLYLWPVSRGNESNI
jgi:hypothetical protein